MSIPLWKFIKFGSYVWLSWFLTLLLPLLLFVILSLVGAHQFIAGGLTMCLLIYGVHISIYHGTSLKLHIEDYKRLHKIFSENPDNIKKSILYSMKKHYCTNIIANDLAKEFNIELTNY